MKRCIACGGFFDAEECPNDHSHVEEYWPPSRLPAKFCGACGHYFRGSECPNSHERILVNESLITLGNAVTCDVSGIWSDTTTLPGILVGMDGSEYRIIVSLPGERGGVASVTLPVEKLS